MTVRKYTSRSQQTTITSAITSGSSSMTVASASTLLGGIAPSSITGGITFTVVIDPDTALEEILDITGASSSTFTITRAVDGSSAQDHSAGAVVRHMLIGRDVREPNTHAETGTGVHGLASTSVVVGTFDTQTLTNKTLTSPTISGSPTITGLGTPSGSSDAAPKSYVDGLITNNQSYATAAATSATSAATSASSAATSASSAQTSATSAATQATAASTSANSAATSATSSATQATAAATSATSAAASATAAASSATSVAGYTSAAATSAASAATSATSAANSVTSAQTSASSAATSASSAATSATSAAASATTAANSVATITTSANSASTSATSAAASATAAATSATSAANSLTSITGQTGSGLVRDMGLITDADTSSTTYINIQNIADAATTSASSASTSASSAATSASSAATSATSAATQATAASTSATSAAASATAASTSATSAAASATAASTSASSAATSASSAATSASSAASAASSAVSGKVDKAGDTMTGPLILSGNPTNALGAAPKQYVDLVTAGINFHSPVIAASITNLGVTYSNGTSGVGATLTADTLRAFNTLDGQSVSVGQRVLIKDQTTQLQNGIYTLTNNGAAGTTAWILTRATDADNSVAGEMANGDVIFATGGTVNAGKTFVNSSSGTITIGTTAITYSAYYAGLPTQTGSAGYFLTTDGTTPSWASLSDWGTV